MRSHDHTVHRRRARGHTLELVFLRSLYQLADPMTGSVVLRGRKSLLFYEQKRSKKNVDRLDPCR